MHTPPHSAFYTHSGDRTQVLVLSGHAWALPFELSLHRPPFSFSTNNARTARQTLATEWSGGHTMPHQCSLKWITDTRAETTNILEVSTAVSLHHTRLQRQFFVCQAKSTNNSKTDKPVCMKIKDFGAVNNTIKKAKIKPTECLKMFQTMYMIRKCRSNRLIQ